MSFDFEARHMIEALRSGIPSRAVGQCFSEARPGLLEEIVTRLDAVVSDETSEGMIICGKYGEGKTHLLNTVFNVAHKNNMVVSMLSLSKETPLDKLYLVYQKLVSNTYLPNRLQPGFAQELSRLTPNAKLTSDLLLFAATQLETDRLYYLLKALVNSDDQDEQFLLQTDLEGDFVANQQIKKIYRRIFDEKVSFKMNFVKTKHSQDYVAFLSHLFKQLGYKGWVILFDESELVGRLGKKARLKAYNNMAHFLFPPKQLGSTFSLFAFTSSYVAYLRPQEIATTFNLGEHRSQMDFRFPVIGLAVEEYDLLQHFCDFLFAQRLELRGVDDGLKHTLHRLLILRKGFR